MRAHRIGVVGAGYVGLTTAACLARLGHTAVCADIDESKVERLNRAEVSSYEPGLAEIVAEGLQAGRLRFVLGARAATADADMVFVCVPTPVGANGSADLSQIYGVLHEVRDALSAGTVVVIKSTVPPGTTDDVGRLLDRSDLDVVTNPEFLREGHTVEDFLSPHRVVVGAGDAAAARRVAELYAPLGAPVVLTDPVSAELVKYASNCFLAMKLSYVNTLAELCECTGGDVDAVTAGMRHDPRIGAEFLRPGPGWGGSCLPKDTQALLRASESVAVDFPLLRATIDTNEAQPGRVLRAVRTAVACSPERPVDGVRLGLLGLTFKAGTDDLRDSPALAVADLLAADGAELTGHDPGVPAGTQAAGPVRVVDDAYLAAKDASALVVLTEWPQFGELDWARLGEQMRHRVVVDTRNHLPPEPLRRAGFRTYGTGRSAG